MYELSEMSFKSLFTASTLFKHCVHYHFIMELKCVQVLLIGICCGFLTCCIAQIDIQRQKVWCEGIKENTYLRNATDCRVWIRCNGPNYPPSSGFCPNPSFFSVEQQRCTSQNDANCFVCPDTTSSSYETVANSCNRFIRCNNGVPSETSCGIGMGFNPETNRCEGAYYQTCIVSIIPLWE